MILQRPTGIQRDDTLLSLDEAAMPARELIVDLTMKLWRGCLIGSAPPILKERYERMKSPYPGDLVVEISRQDPLHGLGYLLIQRTEDEVATYVQYGPAAADVCRWVNADFVALP